jgi:hypothetical protein
MRMPLSTYMDATKMSLPELAARLSELSGGQTFSTKTLWNWAKNRYGFRVIIECDDMEPTTITGAYKENRIV